VLHTLALTLVLSAAPDADKSAAALKDLAAALAERPADPAKLADKPFAAVPLTKADAAKAREAIWAAHVAARKLDRAEELKAKKLTDGKLEMPYDYKSFGKAPAGGPSLWISLHGGGNAPKAVNDGQWENQKKLYTPDEGIYLAPRAPTNTWNLWHEGHIDRLFARLIEDFVAVEGVNPDKVYVLGYSAGGDGVYQIAPRLADRWAAASMMAGHPNDASPLSLRNVPFALQVGGNDGAYNRNKVAAEWGKKLDELEKTDPMGYAHFVKIHEGKGHWMNLEDKAALPWMAKRTRNAIPETVVWKQSGTTHDRSYWLAVPPGTAKGGSLVTATRAGNAVDITAVENVATLVVRFDDRMQDLDKPVAVKLKGKEVFAGILSRTAGTLLRTLADRGDPTLMFDAETTVEVK